MLVSEGVQLAVPVQTDDNSDIFLQLAMVKHVLL